MIVLGAWGCRSSSPAPVGGEAVGGEAVAASELAAQAPAQAPAEDAADSDTAPAESVPAETPADESAVPQSAPAAAEPAPLAADATLAAKAEEGLALDGSFSARWRGRKSGDAQDQDVYGVLAFEVGDASQDSVTAHFLGRISADLDGQGDDESQQVYGSLQDTYGDDVHVDLYEASVDFHRPFDAPIQVRAGRQIDYTTPEFAHFDGLRVESQPIGKSKFVAGAFGGVPVRLYDATSIGDQIAGAWTEARPWKGGRVRADWMYVHQDADPSDFDNSLIGLSLWQRLGEHLSFEAGYTRLEEEDRDVRLRATWNDGEGDMLVQVGYYRLLNPQADFAYEFDPFYVTLQEYQPFGQYRLLVSKSLGDSLRLDLGGDLRVLEDEDDESRLNHGYERGFATLALADLLTDGLDLSLTADAWNSDDQDTRTWGADLTWTPDERWRVSAGSAYALYKYDVADDVERDDVRVWYARVRRKIDASWTIGLEYEFEDDDFDDHHEVQAGATWRF